MEPIECDVCGREVEPSLRGRPRVRHFECKVVASIVSQLEDRLPLIRFAPNERGAELRRRLRSHLLTIGNQNLQSFNVKCDDTRREYLARPNGRTKKPAPSNGAATQRVNP